MDHEGKKKLQVTTENELSEWQWDKFCELIKKEIAGNTKSEMVAKLQADFTTSSRVEQLLSSAVIMDSFKSYFEYERVFSSCGIRGVRFLGTEQDWMRLVEKANELGKLDLGRNWTSFIKGVLPVLTKFLETYQGKVDVDWWNKIMNFRQGRLGSGGAEKFVTGWILALFGFDVSKEVDVLALEEYSIKVR